MPGFFYRLGQMIGPNLRKANWVVRSLTGTEAEAVQAESAVGQDLARALAQQMEFDTEPAVEQLLWDLRERLVPCVAQQRAFHFRAVLSPDINAFALPGGYIFVSRPLFEFCQWDPSELAFVLGHEMAHVVLHHAIDRLMADSVISTAVSRLTLARGVFGQSLASVAGGLLNQGYSRVQELDADRLGGKLMKQAGFDPDGPARVLGRFAGSLGKMDIVDAYFQSHPPIEERIRHITRSMRG